MSQILAVQSAIAEAEGERLPAHVLAARVGMTPKQFHKMLPRWMDRGLLSREKVPGKPFCYFLDEAQLAAYREKAASGTNKLHRESAMLSGFGLVVDTDHVLDRLGFLRMLKERTIFNEYAVLDQIISDYERTLSLRHASITRCDEEDKSQARGRKTISTNRVADGVAVQCTFVE